MRYSIEPRERIYEKRSGFLLFAKKMGKNFSNKYSQKLFDSPKKSTTDAIKTATHVTKVASNRAIENTVETNSDLFGNKIADKITKVSKELPLKKSLKEFYSQND